MASRAAAIADALTTWINDPARAWGTSFTAARTWDPLADLPDLTTLNVQVAPDALPANVLVARGTRQCDYTVWLIFRKKYATSGAVPNSWLDPLVDLVELVCLAAADLTLTGQPAGYLVRVAEAVTEALCDPVDLKLNRQFTGMIELTVREIRPK